MDPQTEARELVNLADLNARSMTDAALVDWTTHASADVRAIARAELARRYAREWLANHPEYIADADGILRHADLNDCGACYPYCADAYDARHPKPERTDYTPADLDAHNDPDEDAPER